MKTGISSECIYYINHACSKIQVLQCIGTSCKPCTKSLAERYILLFTSVNVSCSPSLPPSDSEQDLHLLLECLYFQQNCISSQRQALTTIATMCNNSGKRGNVCTALIMVHLFCISKVDTLIVEQFQL